MCALAYHGITISEWPVSVSCVSVSCVHNRTLGCPCTLVVIHRLSLLEELNGWVARYQMLLSDLLFLCGIDLSQSYALCLQFLGCGGIFWRQLFAVTTPDEELCICVIISIFNIIIIINTSQKIMYLKGALYNKP